MQLRYRFTSSITITPAGVWASGWRERSHCQLTTARHICWISQRQWFAATITQWCTCFCWKARQPEAAFFASNLWAPSSTPHGQLTHVPRHWLLPALGTCWSHWWTDWRSTTPTEDWSESSTQENWSTMTMICTKPGKYRTVRINISTLLFHVSPIRTYAGGNRNLKQVG